MAHDFGAFDRPDLNVRMSSRRRLPRPSASATPSTLGLDSGGFVIQPQVVTYSEFLGMFEDESTPVANGTPFNAFAPLSSGPSRAQSSTYQGLRSPLSVIESGWIKDVFGQDQWIGHGKIEEVDDAAAAVSLHNSEDEREETLSTPRAHSTGHISPSSHNDINGRLPDDIPLNSTPPPSPRPKKLLSLRETPTGSDNHSFKATSITAPAMPLRSDGVRAGSVLDDMTEVALVKENLDLLATCTEDVKEMETFFLAKESKPELELSQHIDICGRLQASLRSLRDTLAHRRQMGAEEWHVRSPSWHQKYSKRLVSLRTTLERLGRLRQRVEQQPTLRPRQSRAILTKLEQHEAKLADLASKYSVAFTRLKLRHLHYLLTEAHQKAKEQKAAQKARLISKASFERLWNLGKAFRADLRHAFNELRQEIYSSGPGPGRSSTAP
ncbi:hypothetical protein CVT26_013604 [Gymnopilus dilepis]|uniref:Uncharacterized protein n=1 Tax=Gymnopilus dilepis TaxID=231916 RepID=A0A409Y5W2_9AGAR|nr:hypothetical protein CVT26_013604 [Gymnopilus dilepis]